MTPRYTISREPHVSSLFTSRRGVEEIMSMYLIACCISYFNRSQNNKGLNKGKLYFSHKQTSKLQLVQKRRMGEHGTAPRGCSGARLLVGPQPLRCFWHLHDQRWKGGKKWGAYFYRHDLRVVCVISAHIPLAKI